MVEILGGGIVGAWRANHVNPLKTKLFFQSAQRVDLAGNTNKRDAFVPRAGGRLQQGHRRSIAHAHPAALREIFWFGHDHGQRFPFVIRVGCDRQHRIHRATAQQFFCQSGGDPCPLRALRLWNQLGSHHPLGYAEEAFLAFILLRCAAMNARFGFRVIGLNKLAGFPASPPVPHSADAAIRA